MKSEPKFHEGQVIAERYKVIKCGERWGKDKKGNSVFETHTYMVYDMVEDYLRYFFEGSLNDL